MEWEEKTLEREILFSGRIIKLRRDRVALPGGGESTREIVEHPGAVVIVPVTGQGEVILVKQYRKAVEEVTLELPAGTLEPGEDPEACARRELEEETGFLADEWRQVTRFYSSPGFCTERLYLFLAAGLREGEQKTDFDERITLQRVPLSQAEDMARQGEITDAKSILGILTAIHWR